MTTYYVSPRRRMARRYAQLADNQRAAVHIPVDVIADEDGYSITALVPGISAEDVKIEILDDVISISGDLLNEKDEEAAYLLRERPSGHFHRTLRLPTALDAGKADAEVINGILKVHVSKVEEAKAKQIKVKAK